MILVIGLIPLTDVVVLLSNVELVAQREGAVALELLRELDGRVGGVGPITLPPLEAQLGVAVPVTAVADHVEDVLLTGSHHALGVIVMRAVDVQVVVDIHLHCVALPTQTRHREKAARVRMSIITKLQNTEYHMSQIIFTSVH